MDDHSESGGLEDRLKGRLEERADERDGERVSTNTPCARCNYNLVGLETTGKCPECGTAVVKSLAIGDGLPPEVIRSVRRGIKMVAWANGGEFALVGGGFLSSLLFFGVPRRIDLVLLSVLGVSWVLGFARMRGYLLIGSLSSRAEDGNATKRNNVRGVSLRCVRAFFLLQMALLSITLAAMAILVVDRGVYPAVVGQAAGLAMLICGVVYVMTCLVTWLWTMDTLDYFAARLGAGRLRLRISDAGVACLLLTVFGAMLMGLGILVSMIVYVGMLAHVYRATKMYEVDEAG